MDTTFNIALKLVDEFSKSIKTEKDLSALSKHLLKLMVEGAMHAEMDERLGYEKHAVAGKNSVNSRNGYSSKTLQDDFGEVQITTPRDRNSTFEPPLIRKGQTRITEFDEQILALYVRGMSPVIEEIQSWQSRPLDDVYPILYLDCIVVKCHQDKRVINKAFLSFQYLI